MGPNGVDIPIWAAGNVSDVVAGVPASAAAGVTAAAAINMNLVMAEAAAAAQLRAGAR